MVRSSGHHRKRSPSRSLSPSDHKRVKSSHRDREKERSRRRSRSRDRIRRSRSRDRKDRDKRPSDSRVRSKPLKIKRRSRSRSRSRSREHTVKKEEKKEVKADDEPFDPTNLDKQKNIEESVLDEDWIITDMVQENTPDEDGKDEMMQNNDVSENSFISNRLYNETQNNHEEDKVNNNEGPDTSNYRSNSRTSESSEYHSSNHNIRHYEKSRSLQKTNGVKKKHLSHNHYTSKVSKEIMDLKLEQAKEFHQLRMRNEKEKHLAEMELLKLQTVYWQMKCSKSASVSEYSAHEAGGSKDSDVKEVIGSDEQVFKEEVHENEGSDIDVKEFISSDGPVYEEETKVAHVLEGSGCGLSPFIEEVCESGTDDPNNCIFEDLINK